MHDINANNWTSLQEKCITCGFHDHEGSSSAMLHDSGTTSNPETINPYANHCPRYRNVLSGMRWHFTNPSKPKASSEMLMRPSPVWGMPLRVCSFQTTLGTARQWSFFDLYPQCCDMLVGKCTVHSVCWRSFHSFWNTACTFAKRFFMQKKHEKPCHLWRSNYPAPKACSVRVWLHFSGVLHCQCTEQFDNFQRLFFFPVELPKRSFMCSVSTSPCS